MRNSSKIKDFKSLDVSPPTSYTPAAHTFMSCRVCRVSRRVCHGARVFFC
jgi:hypothetical protein